MRLCSFPRRALSSRGTVLVDKGGTVALYAAVTENDPLPLEVFPGDDVPEGFEGFSGSDGLAVNASATVFASERGAGADRVQSFVYVPVPEVKTVAPSGVTETGLVLQGTVNPEGEAVKECFFEYGTEVGVYRTRSRVNSPPLKSNSPQGTSERTGRAGDGEARRSACGAGAQLSCGGGERAGYPGGW